MMLRILLVFMLCVASPTPIPLADVTGRWRVTISNGNDSLIGMASLEQSGDKVTGWVGPDESDTTPLSGVVKGDRLRLTTHPKPGFAVPFDTCELVVSGDRLTGSLESKDAAKSTIEFVRTRPDK